MKYIIAFFFWCFDVSIWITRMKIKLFRSMKDVIKDNNVFEKVGFWGELEIRWCEKYEPSLYTKFIRKVQTGGDVVEAYKSEIVVPQRKNK